MRSGRGPETCLPWWIPAGSDCKTRVMRLRLAEQSIGFASDPTAKLLDSGLARLTNARDQPQRLGPSVGTGEQLSNVVGWPLTQCRSAGFTDTGAQVLPRNGESCEV